MNVTGRFTYSIVAALFGLCILLSSPLAARVHEVSIGTVDITREVRGLNGAWGFGFLPDGSMIITEKRGRLFFYKEGRIHSSLSLENRATNLFEDIQTDADVLMAGFECSLVLSNV